MKNWLFIYLDLYLYVMAFGSSSFGRSLCQEAGVLMNGIRTLMKKVRKLSYFLVLWDMRGQQERARLWRRKRILSRTQQCWHTDDLTLPNLRNCEKQVVTWFRFLVVVCLFFWDKVLLRRVGCPWIPDPPASFLEMLNWQAWATIPGKW